MNNVNLGIPDEAFIRGNIPMTKEEVRCISVSKLRLHKDSIFVDVGAGTGSISIEAASIAYEGQVLALDMKNEAIDLIKLNSQKFGINNIQTYNGLASQGLKKIEESYSYIDAIFIGGSGEELTAILDWTDEHLRSGGRIVMNTILLENYHKAYEELTRRGYGVEVIRLHIERLATLGKGHYLKPLNSIFILWAERLKEDM